MKSRKMSNKGRRDVCLQKDVVGESRRWLAVRGSEDNVISARGSLGLAGLAQLQLATLKTHRPPSMELYS